MEYKVLNIGFKKNFPSKSRMALAIAKNTMSEKAVVDAAKGFFVEQDAGSLVVFDDAWGVSEGWKDAVAKALPYMGSVSLDYILVIFDDVPHSVFPGHGKGGAWLVAQVSEGERVRVSGWNLAADRSIRDAKDSALYMAGTNNRPIGPELARELVKLI